jgi:hypothetical protein
MKKAVKKNRKNALFLSFMAVLLIGVAVWWLLQYNKSAKIESDFQNYVELTNQAKENYDKGENYYVIALKDYTKAAEYEIQYANSGYTDKFNLNVRKKIIETEKKIDSLVTEYEKKAALFESYEDKSIGLSQQIAYYKKILTLKPDDKILKEKLEKLQNSLNKLK